MRKIIYFLSVFALVSCLVLFCACTNNSDAAVSETAAAVPGTEAVSISAGVSPGQTIPAESPVLPSVQEEPQMYDIPALPAETPAIPAVLPVPEFSPLPEFSEPGIVFPLALDGGLVVREISGYCGPYLEDGSDDTVYDVLCITVCNEGNTAYQMAEILLDGFTFRLTGILPGDKVCVLEAGRASVDDYSPVSYAAARNLIAFPDVPALHPEIISVFAGDGNVTVRNVSGKTFSGGRLFYKNIGPDGFLGGITYTVSVPALETDAEISLPAGHFSSENSALRFMTYADE